MRFRWFVAPLVALVAAVAAPMVSAEPVIGAGPCADVADGRLTPPPATSGEMSLPVRTDADGTHTLTVAVDDPADKPSAYHYAPLTDGTPAETLGVDAAEVGVFAHPWPDADRPITTFGLYVDGDAGRVRMPMLVIENAPQIGLDEVAAAFALTSVAPSALNTAPFALNLLFPSAGPGFAGDDLRILWEHYGMAGPVTAGYRSIAPFFVWTTYRDLGADSIWGGFVVTHDGVVDGRRGCKRHRIGVATRSGGQTVFGGGVVLVDEVFGSGGKVGSYASTQRYSVGVTAGGTADPAGWTDVYLADVTLSEQRSGSGSVVHYPDHQRNEVTFGVRAGDAVIPIIGLRGDATHGSGSAQERTLALGVYGPGSTFVPVTGVRAVFDDRPGDQWIDAYLAGGPGADVGGAAADVGVWGPTGFVPLVGVHHAGDAPGGRGSHQSFVSVGPWSPAGYHPVVGQAYDGDGPALAYGSRYTMSVGPATPSYVPVAGAVRTDADGGGFVTSVGAFGPSGFVPVAGSGDRRSGSVERRSVGVWMAGSFFEVAEACTKLDAGSQSATVGAAGGGGPSATGLAAAGARDGTPFARPGYC